MEQIALNTYASTEYVGVNVGFFVMPAGVIAIDAPLFPGDVRAWRDRILETAGVPILYVLLTDTHPDRLFSAALLGAPTVASKRAFDQIAFYTDGYWRAITDKWARHHADDASDLSASSVKQPQILLTNRLTLHKGGVDVTFQEIDGAAPGSCWLHLPDQDVLFAGDTVVAGVHPWIAAAPDTRAWMDTLSTLRRARFSETKIVPGRGPVCGIADTQSMSDYLALARRRVRSLQRADRPRGDVGTLVSEFVGLFPVPAGERDSIQRRVRTDLERVYDELAEAQG